MNVEELIQQLADLFAALPQVEAVALGGSRGTASGGGDAASDVDLYLYTRTEITLDTRREIIAQLGGALRADIGQNYWGASDNWIQAASGIEVDMMYFETAWLEEQVRRVLDEHQPGMGYSTCFCYTIQQSRVFYDPRGWFAGLQTRCAAPYPEALRTNIVRYNHPLLHSIISSYLHQIEKAARRADLVSINHRLAALLASYFDILFAVNRQLHPGEKRLVENVLRTCERIPRDFEHDMEAVLQAAGCDADKVTARVAVMLDHLDELLMEEGLLPD